MNKSIYLIWIWWIWVSALARYYNSLWWNVSWSDSTDSELIQALKSEWIDIIIGSDESRINRNINLVIYTWAIPETQKELKKAKELNIDNLTYPQALAKIANEKKLITIAGTHGKSTTTSIASILLKDSEIWINTVVWTILKEFNNRNCYFSNSDYFILEACEYKRSFLNYKQYIWVILNIEIDHLDYYKDLDDYRSAYKEYLDNISVWGYAIINWNDKNCNLLKNIRSDIEYIKVYEDYFIYKWNKIIFPIINMKVPWNHILFDAHIAYTIGYILWLEEKYIVSKLEEYSWVWRRMEYIKTTKYNNILLSDYWHHPTEIELTLKSLKEKYKDKKIVTIFQPHQYNRTLNLIEWFKNCFSSTDTLIIPNIYESRDTEEDKQKINSEKLIELINHNNKYNWDWFEKTIKILEDIEKENKWELVIVLLWAWNIDDLRNKIN